MKDTDALGRKLPDMVNKNAVGLYGTLCWSCGKAYSLCSWSKDFMPVKGWDAKATKHGSFRVYNCPLFIKG